MATYYVTQSGTGAANGTSLEDSWSVASFNTAGNWSATPATSGKISPGDTVILNGTLTTALQMQGGGSAGNRLTILFGEAAKLTAAHWGSGTGAINLFGRHYVTIDGGAAGRIGGPTGDTALVNGIIECTANGTDFANQVNTKGVSATNCQYLIVKNLRVKDIYVRNSTSEANGFGGGIVNNASSATIQGFTVTNCVINDALNGIDSDYGDGDPYEFSFNTVYRCRWGARAGDRNSGSSMSGIRVFNNWFHSWANWIHTGNNYHCNGFYGYAMSNGELDDTHVYNNKFGPGWAGSEQTSGVFFAGKCTNNLIYNNLFVADADEWSSNGFIVTRTFTGVAFGPSRIYNNTLIGGGTGFGFGAGGEGADFTWEIKNNILANFNIGYRCLYMADDTLVSNRNLFFDTLFDFSTSGSGGAGFNFATWQALAGGYDANSAYTDPLLTSTYRLGAGSPAIGAGENLSAFFTTDADGNTRPASGAWDIGAFQYGETPPPTPPAARGRKRRGAKLLSFFR